MTKLSILMPIFNDEDTIKKSIESVLEQTYKNFELIIINDGSTDMTETIILNFKDPRIKYLKQNNQDQLNAILNGSKMITGDIVGLLHGDDLLPDKNFYQDVINYFDKNNNCDAIYGDLITINNDDIETSKISCMKFMQKERVFPNLILNLGRNLYNDFFYAKRIIFDNYIKSNYVIWNTPFWLDLTKKPSLLNVAKVDFSTLKYRINENNYINNELGKWNVVNGNLRTATQLMKYYNLPFFKFQFYIYRVFAKLNITNFYIPIYQKKPFSNPAELIELIISKRVGINYNSNIYFKSLINFYQSNNKRTIKLDLEDFKDNLYYGKDMRLFNKLIQNNKLSDIYYELFKEMDLGFAIIEVKKGQRKIAEDLLKFLNIINITIKEVN